MAEDTGAQGGERISGRTSSLLAWSLWSLSVALTVLSLFLLALNLSHPGTHIFDWWVGNALVVINVTVGAIVASRRPENPVGWLLCLSGVVIGTSSFASQYAIYALLARPDSVPAGEALAWIASWLLPIMIGLTVFYTLLFPTGRLPGSRWRWLAWLTAAFVAVGVVVSSLSFDAYLGSLGPIRNPLGVEGFSEIYKAILYTGAPLLQGAATLSVLLRLRRATGVERQQIKWFAYAAALFAVGIVFNVINLAIDTPRWFEWTGLTVFTASSTTITISIGIAILRHRLYDIDLLINRTLVYGSLTVTLALVYVGSVILLQTLFRGLTGQESQLAVVASTLAIAALFNPLRRGVQSFVDRRFYRRKYDAQRTLASFGAKLRDETELGHLGEDLVTVVRQTVQPAHASLWLRKPMPREKRERYV